MGLGRRHAARALAVHVLDHQTTQVCGAGLAEISGLGVEVLNQLSPEFKRDGGLTFLSWPAGHGSRGCVSPL